MKRLSIALALIGALAAGNALAWGNHSFPAYRAFERMPEVANAAPVTVESLDSFLKAEERSIEALLASQEAWAAANLENYPARPAALAFKANPGRADDARRLAFISALRISPRSLFALYLQPDPQTSPDPASLLPFAAVNSLPEPANGTHRFVGLKAGDQVAPLAVLASASDEPDYGLDINLWDDSPSDWGKVYGFGKLPFGNPTLSFATQAPFHMAFYYQDWILYKAAPFIKRTFPLLRTHQYSSLAALAFRSGHPYWGWRFTGLALHYVQDLTQPYHANLAPGDSTLRMIGAEVLALAGMGGTKKDLIVLLSNRHLALERYQVQLLRSAAQSRRDTGLEQSLRRMDQDGRYPPWSDLYVRDVVAREAFDAGAALAQTLVASMPPGMVSDPAFDFGVKESGIDLIAELSRLDPAKRDRLDSAVAELLGHFGAHSRNAVRGILKAGGGS